ncbi:hypothetical protein HK101_009737 [Irineochytrium annulatum]|nr:hypothetical protein HK101_009737 [Irineochytrium annulatum]
MLPFALFIGLLVPISLFLNIQSITVPGWLYKDDRDRDNGVLAGYLGEGMMGGGGSGRDRDKIVHVIDHSIILVASSVSIAFGIVATGALFVRMLERKIKWSTRITIFGSCMQGLISLFLVCAFIAAAILSKSDEVSIRYTSGIIYGALSSASSLVASAIGFYQMHLNRGQLYEWTLYQLSFSQRQVILLTIATIFYTVAGGLVYGFIEDWDFDDAAYWAVVTFTTIGFGDLSPRTVWGKIILPPFASVGVVLVAFNIYAVREVTLELITFQLADHFSKRFGVDREQAAEPYSPQVSQSGSDPYNTPRVTTAGPSTPRWARPRSLSIDSPRTPSFDSFSQAMMEHDALTHGSAEDSEHPTPIGDMDPEMYNRLYRSVPLTRSHTVDGFSSALPRTLTLSRGQHRPNLTITGDSNLLRRRMVVDATHQTFQKQISRALAVVLANMVGFGALFAAFEGWGFFEGLYFTFVALTTIGYGDYSPKSVQSKAIFIWFIFIGVASITYLGSLLAERALNQWTLTVKLIERRVDRYERKARIKRLHLSDRKHGGHAHTPRGPSAIRFAGTAGIDRRNGSSEALADAAASAAAASGRNEGYDGGGLAKAKEEEPDRRVHLEETETPRGLAITFPLVDEPAEIEVGGASTSSSVPPPVSSTDHARSEPVADVVDTPAQPIPLPPRRLTLTDPPLPPRNSTTSASGSSSGSRRPSLRPGSIHIDVASRTVRITPDRRESGSWGRALAGSGLSSSVPTSGASGEQGGRRQWVFGRRNHKRVGSTDAVVGLRVGDDEESGRTETSLTGVSDGESEDGDGEGDGRMSESSEDEVAARGNALRVFARRRRRKAAPNEQLGEGSTLTGSSERNGSSREGRSRGSSRDEMAPLIPK